jgi:very-short-patch-repair endonuclease
MLVEPSRTVEVCVDHGRDAIVLRGVRAQQRRDVPQVQLTALPEAGPLWVTAAAQTVLDCAVGLPLLEAVVVCDSALRAGDVSLYQLEAASRDLRGVADARRIRQVLALADARSGSVLESVLRVRLLQAGMSDLQTQQVLRNANGERLLRVDFCFPKHRLVVEADGQKWHQDPVLDRRLDNQLAAAGWRVLRYTWSDVVHDGAAVVAEIAAALGRGTGTVQVDREQAA